MVNDESINHALQVFSDLEKNAYADLEGNRFEKVWTPFAPSFLQEIENAQPAKPIQNPVFEEPENVQF